MQEATSTTSVDQLLSELACTLGEERDALIRMNAEGIERSAERKASLNDELIRHQQDFNESHRARLRILQTDIRHNLILLVHARDHIQSTLGILTGRPLVTGPFQKPAAECVRLDLRG